MAILADGGKYHHWAATIDDCLSTFQTSLNGLSQHQAEERLLQYGRNELISTPRLTAIEKFLRQLLNPLILILLFASLISAYLGEVTNFLIIFTIILVSLTVDFYQQHHAEKTAEKLKMRVLVKTIVKRDGKYKELPIAEIVPGDIIQLSAGNIIPADGRVFASRGLNTDQSSLTGESYPQEKNATILSSRISSIHQLTNSVFMGTHIISGEGSYIVTRTGPLTEFGRIAATLNINKPETAFDKGIKDFGLMLMKYILLLVILIFFVNALLKHDLITSFLFSMALAIGLTPELLPIIVALNLSKGAIAMSKKEVIVKDLPSIQNFGSMEVLCTDKTGTLTENAIQLERYEDVIGQENNSVLALGYLNSFYQSGIQSPLEAAILKHHEIETDKFRKVDEIPFDFERRRLSVVFDINGNFTENNDSKEILIVKGAPEEILKLSTNYLIPEVSDQMVGSLFTNKNHHRLTDAVRHQISERFVNLSKEGFRVLAVAVKKIGSKHQVGPQDEADLTIVGLMAFLDPPKISTKDAIKHLEERGIELKVLTGDNEQVTNKVCQELRLPIKGSILGAEINNLTDYQLQRIVGQVTIFARLDPLQKQRIIKAIKNNGKVVGFLGDGINDAPALQSSDIGISVNNAVDVAKEAADIILLKKDLSVLIAGVIEGRKTHANLMKYIMVGTSVNAGNMFSMAGASIILPFLPILPTQLLLNNLMFDMSQLSIPSDSVDEEFLLKPRRWNYHFIRQFMMVFGLVFSVFDYLTFFVLFYLFKASASLFQTGWFIESLAAQLIIVFSIRTKLIPFYRSKPSLLLILSTIVMLVISLILPLTPLAKLFSFTPPPLSFYIVLGLLLVTIFVVVEITKRIFFSKYDY